jgi:cyclophilin family peptidyl-prolyl cis-trans isomerase
MKLVAGSLVLVLLLSPTAVTLAQTGASAKPATPGRKSPGAGPVLVVETVKGTFEVETYPTEAPKTVEHVLALVKRNFYNGLRVHRMEPNFVVQFGDPQTRDMTKRADWGTRDSGDPIGALEVSKRRTHVTGAVAMAHREGDPKGSDSQMYVVLSPRPELNGKYTVFGQVISGMDVVQKLRIPDVIRRVTVRDEAKK